MSGIKPRLVRSLKESDKHWVEELDSVLWGLRTTPDRSTGYTPFFMVYGTRLCYPTTLFMTHLKCACTKREKPNWSAGQPRCPGGGARRRQSPFSILSTAGSKISSREVRAKTYNIGELVLRLPKKKKDKLKPKWEGPFIIDEVLTGGVYRLRDASDNRLEPNPWNAARL